MIQYLGRLKRLARRSALLPFSQAAILLYHRVAEVPTDPHLLCVTPQHFAEQLTVLRQSCHVLSLQKLVSALREGSIPRRAVVVTFDDGYADNLVTAKPLLERHEVPATVFVSTGYLGGEREFWWDELDALLLQPGTLPALLELTIGDVQWRWPLGGAATYHEEDFNRYRRWNVLSTTDPTPRQAIYRALCQLLRPLPAGERRSLLDGLWRWAGIAPPVRAANRQLLAEEVARLAADGIIEVGAHTETHSMLSALPLSAQKTEILRGRAQLEEILGQPVATFSYPYGNRSDYTAETARIVRNAGFRCACSNFPKTVWRRSDPFQLPRFLVRDWDGETFARQLGGWLRG